MTATVWVHHLNAASVLFPAWERAFAAVAGYYRPKVSSALAGRIDAFMKEETSHASAHEAYNRRHGLAQAEAEEFKKTRIIHRKPGHKVWLGTMVSIEHLAVCMGRMYLDRFQGRFERDHKLFHWHAKEEIGHKALAIDIWRELGYSDAELRAIARQNQAYVLRFITSMMIRKTEWRSMRNWLGFANWSWWMMRKVLIPMLAIYIPGFHPDWFDDRRYLA